MCCRGGGGVGWEWVEAATGVGDFWSIIGLDTGKPMVIHYRGGIEFHRECVRLLIDILGMNHKIMLHGWNGCGEVARVWLGLCNCVVWNFWKAGE